jgi:hypothetical protein
LRERLVDSVAALQCAPDKSFPHALPGAAYTGFLRMLHNPRIIERPPVAEVYQDTVRRLATSARVLAVHDTSEIVFGGEVRREGLGRLHKHTQGFLAHTCLAVSTDRQRVPLGVLHVEPLVRCETSFADQSFLDRYVDPDRESQRWHRGVAAAEAAVGRAGVLIHVCDREADDYTLMLQIADASRSFIIRQRTDRVLAPQVVTEAIRTARALLHSAAVPVVGREATISRRKGKYPKASRKQHPDRDLRVARLEVEAMPVQIQRPDPVPKHLAPSLALNLVHVREVDVPAGQEPVDWWLWTSEPIDTPEQVLQIVDWYCARWVIEMCQSWDSSSGVLYLAPRSGSIAQNATNAARLLTTEAA